MSYRTMGLNLIERIIANCDKASLHGDSKVIKSPWGVFTMYRKTRGRRYYSLRGSKMFNNRGSLRIGSIKRMLRSLIGA